MERRLTTRREFLDAAGRGASALMALDLPTFERPAKATSGPASGGKS